jgi:hypothetical protein
MSGHRLLHVEESTSRKVTALSDFEYRIYEQVKLSSDDFGVMTYTATLLRGQNARFRSKATTEKQVLDGLRRLVTIGLLLLFEHQDESYVCCPVWQTWQKIRFPKRTAHPKPPADTIARCDPETQYLFSFHPGGRKLPKIRPEDSRNGSGSSPGQDRERSNHQVSDIPDHANANAKEESARETIDPPKPGSRSARVASIIGRRDLGAFWEGPVFNIPQKWAETTLRLANGALSEADLTQFAQEVSASVEASGEDLSATGNLLSWLDGKLRLWRNQRTQDRRHGRIASQGASHLDKVAAMERGQ